MSGFRFSIATFLTVVTLLALGLAAMASQSALATSLVFTAFLVLLGIATAGAFLSAPHRRAFWVGFAIFGWTYWFVEFDTGASRTAGAQPVVSAISFRSGRLTTRAQPAAPVRLITGNLMDWLESVMTANLSVGSKVTAQWRGGSYYTGTITAAQSGQYLIVWDDGSPQQWTPPNQILPNSPNLRLAAHATFGGLFALLGGVLVMLLFGERKPAAAAAG
jgi:hypothetical protein